jgi:flagellar biosynthesis GTPase FlhF
MSRLGVVFSFLFLVACGPSEQEINNTAVITCNIMRESILSDGAEMIREVNAARKAIQEEPFLGSSSEILQAFEHDLCPALVRNDPSYAQFLNTIGTQFALCKAEARIGQEFCEMFAWETLLGEANYYALPPSRETASDGTPNFGWDFEWEEQQLRECKTEFIEERASCEGQFEVPDGVDVELTSQRLSEFRNELWWGPEEEHLNNPEAELEGQRLQFDVAEKISSVKVRAEERRAAARDAERLYEEEQLENERQAELERQRLEQEAREAEAERLRLEAKAKREEEKRREIEQQARLAQEEKRRIEQEAIKAEQEAIEAEQEKKRLEKLARLAEEERKRNNTDAKLMYKVDVELSRRAKRCSGFCTLTYRISDMGLVISPFVADESDCPDRIFVEPAIEAVEQFEYLPKLVNGKRVESIGQYQFSFNNIYRGEPAKACDRDPWSDCLSRPSKSGCEYLKKQ